MICTLTERQQEQFYIKIVKDLESAINTPAEKPFTVKEYTKSIYDKVIANKKGSPELGLQYAALVPQFILAAEGLNPRTIGQLLASEHSNTLNLLTSFDNDIQNIIDYVAKPEINPETLTEIIDKTPTIGSNVPPIPVDPGLQDAIDEQERFKPMVLNFFSTTGRQSPIVNGKETNVPEPSKALTYLILKKVLTKFNDEKVLLGSDLQYYKHKGLKLRLVNETQLPVEGRETGEPASEGNLVYVITDNDGNFLKFDEDGFVSDNNQGKFAYYSFRAPSNKNKQAYDGLIEEILERRALSLIRQGATEKGLNKIIAQERKALKKKLYNEFALANALNVAYAKNPNDILLIEFTGGGKGYVELEETESSKVNISPEEFDTLSIRTTGEAFIKFNDVSSPISIKGLPLSKLPANVIDNLVNVLAAAPEKGISATEKTNYLGTFINIKSKSNARIIKDEFTDQLYLEINGTPFDLNNTTPEALKQALLDETTYENVVHFNISKAKNYTDIQISDAGKVTRKNDVNYQSLLKEYSIIGAKPNDEGNIVELNGHFDLKYVPQITQEKKVEKAEKAKKLTKPGRTPWDEVELAASNLIELKTTPEQQAKADQWWETSPISKIKIDGKAPISLQRLQHITNTKAFATWSISGIKLNAGSDSTHIYHEAWHAFSQLFLTKEEKDKLYTEASNQEGTFKVVSRIRDENGNIVPKLIDVAFKDASAKQLEEYIAEKYRAFAIAKGDTKELKGQMKSVFKRIWEFLKSFFKGVTIQDTANDPKLIKPLNDMFNALYTGDLSNYSPSIENVSFSVLNAGIISVGNINDELNYTDTTKVIKSLDGLMSQLISERSGKNTKEFTGNWTVRGLTNNTNKISLYQEMEYRINLRYAELLRDKMEAGLDLTETQEEHLEEYKDYIGPKGNTEALNEAAIQTLNNNIKLLDWTLTNFSNDITATVNDFTDKSGDQGVVAYHMINSEFADLLKLSTPDELDIDDTSKENLEKTQRMGGSENNEKSSLDDANSLTIYLIKSLLKQDTKGNLQLNDLGFPSLVDFIPTWNKLRRQLGGHMNTDVLYNKILELSKEDFIITQLAQKLGNPEKTNKEQDTLWLKFVHDFNRPVQKIIVQNIEIRSDQYDNETVTIKVGQASAASNKVKSRWQTKFKTATVDSNPYILTNSNKENYLNLPKIVNDFLIVKPVWNDKKTVAIETHTVKPGKEIAFLNAIGLFLSDTEENRNDLLSYLITQDGEPVNYIAKYIGQLNNADAIIKDSVDFFYKPNQTGQIISYTKAEPELRKTRVSPILAQGGFINNIAAIEAANSDEYSPFSKLTAEGKIKQEEALPSTESKIVYGLQNAKNFNDFSNEDGQFAYMSFLAKQNNPWAKQSRILKSLYTDAGKRNAVGISIINLGGMSLITPEETKGVSKAGMSPRDKTISDFNELLLAGISEHMRPGSKNSFFATKIDNIFTYTGKKQSNLYIDSFEFIIQEDGTYRGSDLGFDIMLPYVQAEMERMNMFYAKEEQYKKNKNFSAKTTGDFALFAGILEEDTKKELKKIRKKLTGDKTLSELLDEVEGGKDLKEKIRAEIKYYFDSMIESQSTHMSKFGMNTDNTYSIISPKIREEIVKKMKGVPGMTGNITDLENKEFRKQIDAAAIKSFIYNNYISNIETSILYYGDPTVYNHTKEEAHKRFSVFQSGGSGFPTDSTTRNMVNKLATPLTKLKTNKNKEYTGKLNTAVIEDNFNLRENVYINLHDLFITNLRKKGITGEALNIAMYGAEKDKDGKVIKIGERDEPIGGKMYPYFNLTTTDGQGYISFDSYRQLKYAEGKWSDPQESLYQRIVKNEPYSLDDITEMFPVYKLQMAGHLKTPLGELPVMSAHKFALFPLIPDVIKDSPLEELHNQMMEQGMDYITHESGSKLAHITSSTSEKGKPKADTIFDKATGRFISGTKFTKNVVYAEYLKNQVEVNTEFKGKTIFSTQFRVMLTAGLVSEGLPIDFRVNSPEEERKLAWDGLTTEQQEAESPYQKLINTYTDLVNRLVDLTTEEMIAKIDGWKKGVDGRYTGPKGSMVEFVRNELKQQGLTDHEIEYIDIDGQGNLVRDVSGSPIADRIEKMLMAIINNKVVKQTVTGEPLVEVSVANTLKFKNIKAAVKQFGNEDLSFYEADVNGEKVTKSCQAKIAMQGSFVNLFNLKDNDNKEIAVYDSEEIEVDGVKRIKYTLNFEASRVRLNELIRNEEWLNRDNNRKKLRLTGVRIPVQGLNSMEFIEIAEFLPPSAGPIIILPAEIVAKSGTDFDVDKLTTYMPTISRLGNWLSDTFETKKDVQNEIEKVSKQLETLLKGKVDTTTTDATKVVKELIKNYRAGKGDIGKHLAELRLKRDVINTQVANNVADIKAFIRNAGIQITLYSALSKFMKSYDNNSALEAVKTFSNIPAVLTSEAITKTYTDLLEASTALDEIKKELKEGYQNKDAYLDVDPEIKALTERYDELKDQERNFIKYVQNSLIDSIISILELPVNADRLLTANDTHKTKVYADEMEEFVQDQDYKASRRASGGKLVTKGISPTTMFEYGFNFKKHQDNFVGKDSLAITATSNKGNIAFNNAGAYLPLTETFEVSETYKDKDDILRSRIVQKEVPTEIYLNVRRSPFVENGKIIKAISLSSIYDSMNDDEISEIMSQLMNGMVDVEKDAWVAFIQGNREVTPTILFLLETGVPFKDIVYYVNNPLIRTYINQLKNNKGLLGRLTGEDSNFARPNAIRYVWEKTLNRSGKVPSIYKITQDMAKEYGNTYFTTDRLKEIAKYDFKKDKNTVSLTDQDVRAGFLHFLYIEQLAKNPNEIRTATNFDTKKSSNLQEVYNRQDLVDELYESTKMPRKVIEYYLENSPTSGFKTTDLVQDMFGFLFKFRNNEVLQEFTSAILKDYAIMKKVKQITGLERETFPVRFKNALTLYLFVNNLKSFSIGESTHYKGMSVNYVTGGTKSIEVKEDKSGYGPAPLVININQNLLTREFKNKLYITDAKGKGSYSEQGLAAVKPINFYGEQATEEEISVGEREYYDFVIEREYYRAIKPIEKVIDKVWFNKEFARVKDKGFYKEKSDADIKNIIYERYLKNTALENSYNFNTMFFDNQKEGNTIAYARKLSTLLKKYPEMEKTYSVLKQLSPTTYNGESLGTKNNAFKNLMNIALKDASELTPGSTKQYHDDLVDLANPNINKTIINTPEAIEDNELLSDMFRRFPMYIFMQGGMNKNEFSFNSILPYSDKSSPYSTIMNDALVRTSEALKWTKYTDEKTVPENALRKVNKTGKYYAKSGLLNRVLNKFLENNNIKNRKANQATAFKNLLEPMVLAPLLKGNKRKTIIDILKYYKPVIKRLTYTSEDLVYTLNTTNITKGEMTELASLYQGEAFFITDNPIFKDSSIGLKTDSIAEIDDSLDTMFDVLGDGKALIFNENGYYSPDKVLQDHITTKLYEKFGIVNTPIQPEIVITPKVAGTKLINDADVASFNKYLVESKGVKRNEFFTSTTTFKVFFNSETGKREKAPQTATWVLNSQGLYDLVDKEVGEVYISNVDLATGYQMIDEPVVNTPVIKPVVKTISEAYGVKTAETNPSVEKTKQFINLIQPQIINQAYQENKTGNKMFMYGLRWTRKNKAFSPIINKSFANKGLSTDNALAKDGYVYDTVDQNRKSLAPITDLQPIINEIQRVLGRDMSDYDAVIGNIYLPGQRIQTHRDTTESLSARNYPVIVYTIGAGNAINIYEDLAVPGKSTFASGTDKKTSIPTKNGTIYTFGMDGKGRFELGHDTPHAIKKGDTLNPITMPDGTVIKDYTITLTFRRAQDLEPGMPISPAKLNIPSDTKIDIPSISKGIEISSYSKGIGAALTNPTEMAKWRGNLVESYPVNFRGVTYKDSEAAYQALKKTSTMDEGPNSTYNLMVDIITAKLEQHPRLVEAISKQGGSAWLLASTHQPTKKNSVWETGGKNWFIKALNEAYIKTNTKPSVGPIVLDKATSLIEYRGKSGGAKGYDAEWDIEGAFYGVTFDHYLLPIDGDVADSRLKAKNIKPVDATIDVGDVAAQGPATGEAQVAVTNAERIMGRIEPNHVTRNTKKIRNYAQIKNADGVFAIGSLIPKGTEITISMGRVSKLALVPQVNGGTSVAVQLGIMMNKPVYVFNQIANNTYAIGWYKWDVQANDFVNTPTPILTKNFAGIGTSSNTTELGKQAIKDVYQETFSNLADAEETFKSC